MMDYADGMITRRGALRRAAYVLGGTLSANTVAGVLAGWEGAVATAAGATVGGAAVGPRVSRILTPEQDEMILAIGEYLIPTTDTPGARTARVNEFIDAMLADFYPAERRDRFLAGLERVNASAHRRFGAGFIELAPEQQLELAEALHRAAFPGSRGEQESRSDNAADPGDPDPQDVGPDAFMATLKELVVVGYYTSRVGATEELAVNPMGVWRADIPYSEVGRAWA